MFVLTYYLGVLAFHGSFFNVASAVQGVRVKFPKLFSLIDKAVHEYALLQNGDAILLACSGGKDSTVLAEYLANRKKQKREDFRLEALHIATDISPPLSEKIHALYEEWEISLHIKQISVLDRVRFQDGKKMNCWWCSTQRRTELNNFAIENGFNKIAFGHHLDDVLETLFMNAMQKGELSTMIPSLPYEKYPVTVIRPLYYVDEQSILRYVDEAGYARFTCTCNYQDNSKRKLMREKIAHLTDNSFHVKMQLLSAVQNINTEYLPQIVNQCSI